MITFRRRRAWHASSSTGLFQVELVILFVAESRIFVGERKALVNHKSFSCALLRDRRGSWVLLPRLFDRTQECFLLFFQTLLEVPDMFELGQLVQESRARTKDTRQQLQKERR